MAEKFVGKFKLVSSDNFEEYMKKLGVGFALRKLGNQAKPVAEIKIEGDTWTISSVSTLKSTSVTFKLGQEVEETTADGRLVKTTFTMDGDKLVQKQKATKEGEFDSTCVREIKDGDLHMNLDCEGVHCTRIYKREP